MVLPAECAAQIGAVRRVEPVGPYFPVDESMPLLEIEFSLTDFLRGPNPEASHRWGLLRPAAGVRFKQELPCRRRSARVNGSLAFGASLPPAVNPEPLAGILSNVLLNDGSKAGSVFQGVALVVSGGSLLDLRAEVQDVFLLPLLPKHKAGQHSRPRFQGDTGQSRGSAGLMPKER